MDNLMKCINLLKMIVIAPVQASRSSLLYEYNYKIMRNIFIVVITIFYLLNNLLSELIPNLLIIKIEIFFINFSLMEKVSSEDYKILVLPYFVIQTIFMIIVLLSFNFAFLQSLLGILVGFWIVGQRYLLLRNKLNDNKINWIGCSIMLGVYMFILTFNYVNNILFN